MDILIFLNTEKNIFYFIIFHRDLLKIENNLLKIF